MTRRLEEVLAAAGRMTSRPEKSSSSTPSRDGDHHCTTNVRPSLNYSRHQRSYKLGCGHHVQFRLAGGRLPDWGTVPPRLRHTRLSGKTRPSQHGARGRRCVPVQAKAAPASTRVSRGCLARARAGPEPASWRARPFTPRGCLPSTLPTHACACAREVGGGDAAALTPSPHPPRPIFCSRFRDTVCALLCLGLGDCYTFTLRERGTA